VFKEKDQLNSTRFGEPHKTYCQLITFSRPAIKYNHRGWQVECYLCYNCRTGSKGFLFKREELKSINPEFDEFYLSLRDGLERLLDEAPILDVMSGFFKRCGLEEWMENEMENEMERKKGNE